MKKRQLKQDGWLPKHTHKRGHRMLSGLLVISALAALVLIPLCNAATPGLAGPVSMSDLQVAGLMVLGCILIGSLGHALHRHAMRERVSGGKHANTRSENLIGTESLNAVPEKCRKCPRGKKRPCPPGRRCFD